MDTKTANKRIIIALISGVIIGAGAVWVLMAQIIDREIPRDEDETELISDSNDVNISVTSGAQMESARIVVGVQLFGKSVRLQEVALPESSWVAIHEDVDGKLGNILGAQRFDQGVHSGTVDLLRETVGESLYYAVVYRDDGDKVFNLDADAPAVDVEGALIMTAFRTTSGSPSQ
jgi:hypothetical protein|tara:strand:+ start:43344 stop:43868 length:525 start_codon:yes stop_codon:yes gene_type:complete